MPDVLRIKVYDNGGKSFDRYTVVWLYGDGSWDARSMSERPNHPQGFNQYIGDHMDRGYHTPWRYQRWMGKPMKWSDLNTLLMEAICNATAWV